jgi:hypothetical protein
LEKEEAATVANSSKGANNDWTINRGCNDIFSLDYAASMEKGTKKKRSYCKGGTLCCLYKQGIKRSKTTG